MGTTQGAEPNGTFCAWLAQGQYLRRLGGSQNQLIWNTSFQWASDPLLSLEQFSLGGANTVRGYRENQVVRDMGFLTSVELRFPLLETGTGAPIFEVAPFLDLGWGWNTRGSKPQPSDLSSAGVGLIYNPHRRVNARLYWGYGFREFKQSSSDLQDHGLHFKVTFTLL
jgi:hemolysin activation/secretion protein